MVSAKGNETGEMRTSIAQSRRDFLKRSVTLAAVQLVAAIGSRLLPKDAFAEGDRQPRILIAYYSRTGNVEAIAEQLRAKTGADMFRVETVNAYPVERPAAVDVPKQELESGNLPGLQGAPPDMSRYDLVIVGSPVWWATVSTPMMRFLQQADFAGRRVAGFNTNGGGVGRFHQHFKQQVKNAGTIYDGISFSGSRYPGWKTEGPISGEEYQTAHRLEVDRKLDAWLASML
ncbi:flavodoxin [Desulfovibrio sp. DV]|uniref:flavodoxin n=1 Tax=Desulfovibrio sp. DV TaxID=1844708 RepID=UPI00094BC392|nr:flavodoxin [Desulfovibrio sp. DV]